MTIKLKTMAKPIVELLSPEDYELFREKSLAGMISFSSECIPGMMMPLMMAYNKEGFYGVLRKWFDSQIKKQELLHLLCIDEDTGVFMGFVVFTCVGEAECFIDYIYVKPEYRNHGVATGLIEQLKTIAPMLTAATLHPSMWERCGFKVRGRTPNALDIVTTYTRPDGNLCTLTIDTTVFREAVLEGCKSPEEIFT